MCSKTSTASLRATYPQELGLRGDAAEGLGQPVEAVGGLLVGEAAGGVNHRRSTMRVTSHAGAARWGLAASAS